MSQSYMMVGSVENLRCSKKDFEALKKLWNALNDEQDKDGFAKDPDGFDLDLMDVSGLFGHLYIYADEYGDFEIIDKKVLKKIGKIVEKAGLSYLTFSYSSSNSRNLQGSAGGGEFRLYPDGVVKHPKLVY